MQFECCGTEEVRECGRLEGAVVEDGGEVVVGGEAGVEAYRQVVKCA